MGRYRESRTGGVSRRECGRVVGRSGRPEGLQLHCSPAGREAAAGCAMTERAPSPPDGDLKVAAKSGGLAYVSPLRGARGEVVPAGVWAHLADLQRR